MRALAAVTLAVMFIAGCTGMQVGTVASQPCTIYEDFGANPENSIIAKNIKNPCTAQRLLATAAKMPVIWGQKKYIDSFNQWSGVINQHITSGITYQALQKLIMMEIVKYNSQAGMALLILSDDIMVFGTVDAPISQIDQKLLLASLNDLRVQVANLSLIAIK